MKEWPIIISMVVAILIGITTSWVLGILLGLSCVVYQVILDYGRSTTRIRTVRGATLLDIARSGVFLIPLIVALGSGAWLAAGAIVVVFGVNLMMS
jgi:hypothetical protein